MEQKQQQQNEVVLARDMTLEQFYTGLAMNAILSSPTEMVKMGNLANDGDKVITEVIGEVSAKVAAKLVEVQAKHPNQAAVDAQSAKGESFIEAIRSALSEKLGANMLFGGELKVSDLTGKTPDHDKPE